MQVLEFAGVTQTGAAWSIAQTINHSANPQAALLIVFVPAAFTPTCTTELTAFDTAHATGQLNNAVIVSCDPKFGQRIWAETHNAQSIPILSDFWPHGALATTLNAFDPQRGVATRSSVLIDNQGNITWRYDAAPTETRDPKYHQQAIGDVKRFQE